MDTSNATALTMTATDAQERSGKPGVYLPALAVTHTSQQPTQHVLCTMVAEHLKEHRL